MGIYRSQGAFFRKAYETGEHGWPATGTTPEVARFIRKIKSLGRGRDAVDIGCGEGRHSLFLARQGFRIFAFDIEPLAVKKAKRVLREAGVGDRVSFRVGDILRTPFPEGRFDLAVDYGCFHHLLKRDWNRYVVRVSHLLKEKGFLILSVFTPRFQHVRGKKAPARKWLVHRGHYDRFFAASDIRRLFGVDFAVLAMSEDSEGFLHALLRLKR